MSLAHWSQLLAQRGAPEFYTDPVWPEDDARDYFWFMLEPFEHDEFWSLALVVGGLSWVILKIECIRKEIVRGARAAEYEERTGESWIPLVGPPTPGLWPLFWALLFGNLNYSLSVAGFLPSLVLCPLLTALQVFILGWIAFLLLQVLGWLRKRWPS